MNEVTSDVLIIVGSAILIVSFFFGELSKRTSIPSVLLLIVLGVLVNSSLQYIGNNFEKYKGLANLNFDFTLEILGVVGLIMIVLEAALELKLDKEKIIPITKSLVIAFVGLIASTWLTALVFQYFIEGIDWKIAWLYATPISILSSAIIIPSVVDLVQEKKEFHIYESTFSDILGIMLFYFLKGQIGHGAEEGGAHMASVVGNFLLTTVIALVIGFICSYALIIIFQKIKTSVKLFLLLAILLLIYNVAKMAHLSQKLIIILIFGLLVSNMDVFFRGKLKKWLDHDAAHDLYHGLHVITMESAFVVRTFFFVIFGITISFESLSNIDVLKVSAICLAIVFVVRFLLLRASIGKDIIPQVYIAPRGLITVLLYNAIPDELLKEFPYDNGIPLLVIIGTSIVMTIAMIYDKRRANGAISAVKNTPVRAVKWRLPD